MLLFKTTVNKNGWCHYLIIDIENKRFSRQPFSIFRDYIVVNVKAIKEIAAGLEASGYTETIEYL